jgi:membrane fusion protein
MRPLFRPEALQAQQQGWLGRVQLVRPLSLALLTTGALVLLLALAVFLSLAGYTRKATASGMLMPDHGLIRLVPAAAGTVLERRVSEGQAVQAGDVLFVLALEQPLFDPAVRERVQRSLAERQRSLQVTTQQQRALLASQEAALGRRLEALAGESAQLEAEQGLQQQRLALAQEALARLESLLGQQFISAAQVQTQQAEVLALQAALQGLARQRAALARERAELDGERRALPLLAGDAQGTVERDLAQLEREAAELEADRRLLVRAPQAGVVSALLAEPGQAVSPASALASLVPAGSTLQAHLYAPSSAIGFVQPGQPVRLRLAAFPYQKFGHLRGRVSQVSRVPLAASELAALALGAGALPAGQPMFRITVALEEGAPAANGVQAPQAGPPRLPLAAGMQLSADVQLEQRRLIEWLFEPALGWRSRQAG